MQSDTCYGNNTVFNENDIDNNAGSRVTCFRRGSTSTDNVLFNNEGEDVSCDSGAVQCVIGSGFITIVTPSNFGGMRNGTYLLMDFLLILEYTSNQTIIIYLIQVSCMNSIASLHSIAVSLISIYSYIIII